MIAISLLRGINLGPRNRVSMEALRSLYESLGLCEPRTYIQSGNVVFRTNSRDLTALAKRITEAIEKKLQVKSPVVLRTISEWRETITRNPFAKEAEMDPARLLVIFCSSSPASEDVSRVEAFALNGERLTLQGREIFAYFPNGVGRSKLGTAIMGTGIRITATARNWNTVLQLAKLGDELERAK